MKRSIWILACLVLLLALGVTAVMAGDGDPQPGVVYNPYEGSCGVPAGEFGYYMTYDWWWATYSNGVGILKCKTQLDPGVAPPATTVLIPGDGVCGTPGGSTENYFTKVFPDGAVHLICKY